MGRVRFGSVESGVRKDLGRLPEQERVSGLAMAAIMLARRLDAEPEEERDAATLVRELRATLEQLGKVNRPVQEKDFLDDLAARRSSAGRRNAAGQRNASG